MIFDVVSDWKQSLFLFWYTDVMNVRIKKLHDNALIPTRAHKEDAGIDLYAYGDHEVRSGEMVKIPLGVAMEIETGYVGLIWDKSSIGAKDLKTLGGVVDAGYRGEVQVMIRNLGKESYTFLHGHKVAQMLIQKVELCDVIEVDELSSTVRGEGGFGSTGK